MNEFKTKVADAGYSITFETYDRKAYEQVKNLCRLLVDGKDGGAIPIEWIDGYIKRRANDVNIYAEILFISDMVKEWEKENERP